MSLSCHIRGKHTLRVMENRVLGKTLGAERGGGAEIVNTA